MWKQMCVCGKTTAAAIHKTSQATRWKRLMNVVIVLKRESNPFQVIAALNTTSRLAGLLYGRKQQRDENCHDCDHHQFWRCVAQTW